MSCSKVIDSLRRTKSDLSGTDDLGFTSNVKVKPDIPNDEPHTIKINITPVPVDIKPIQTPSRKSLPAISPALLNNTTE